MVRVSTTLILIAAIALIASFTVPTSAQVTPTGMARAPTNLAPPASSVLLFSLGARGVQIYTCQAKPNDATSFVWTFTVPEAELLNEHGEVVGRHFAGPTWQAQDGSAVIGVVVQRADAPEPGAIPWLLLAAKEHEGSGVFATITHIQRLDTSGGVAPSEGCDAIHAGAQVRVPYTARYAFYYPAALATPGTTPEAQSGAVTSRVFTCPADLRQPAGRGQLDQAALLAACTPFPSPVAAPTVRTLPDGASQAGTVTAPGVYRWDGLTFGDYAVGGSGQMRADVNGLLVTDATGRPLQNPVLRLDLITSHVECRYFYFRIEATPPADPAS